MWFFAAAISISTAVRLWIRWPYATPFSMLALLIVNAFIGALLGLTWSDAWANGWLTLSLSMIASRVAWTHIRHRIRDERGATTNQVLAAMAGLTVAFLLSTVAVTVWSRPYMKQERELIRALNEQQKLCDEAYGNEAFNLGKAQFEAYTDPSDLVNGLFKAYRQEGIDGCMKVANRFTGDDARAEHISKLVVEAADRLKSDESNLIDMAHSYNAFIRTWPACILLPYTARAHPKLRVLVQLED